MKREGQKMLEYIWFVALMLVSVALGVIYSIKDADADNDGFSSGQWLIGAFSAAVMALVISWERTGAVVLTVLRASLPQSGTAIAELTAYTLIGIAGLLVVFIIPVGASFLTYFLRSKKSTNAPAAQ
jgi:hypothetical protein